MTYKHLLRASLMLSLLGGCSLWDDWMGTDKTPLPGTRIAVLSPAGGLQAKAGLETAVILSLFVDRRVPVDHPLAWLAGPDRRGWWGDGVRQTGEVETGSLLWLLERAPLDAQTARWAEAIALDALATLVQQGAVVKVEARAEARLADNRLDLGISLYGRSGVRIYARKFERLWQQEGLA